MSKKPLSRAEQSRRMLRKIEAQNEKAKESAKCQRDQAWNTALAKARAEVAAHIEAHAANWHKQIDEAIARQQTEVTIYTGDGSIDRDREWCRNQEAKHTALHDAAKTLLAEEGYTVLSDKDYWDSAKTDIDGYPIEDSDWKYRFRLKVSWKAEDQKK